MPVNVKGILFAAAAVGAALVLARARSALPALAKPASGRSAQDTPCARIDAYVQGQTARLNLPGAALAIVEGDEIAHLRTSKTSILLVHAFVGWLLCAATMGIGMAVTTMQNALIIHAIAAPIFF